MIIPGRVKNGVVVLETPTTLPEGAAVGVCYPAPGRAQSIPKGRRIDVPLVLSDRPGSVRLTGERIAEILDEEDVSARH